MIASMGGAEITKDGSRNYAGSGGMIGGLSFKGGNWSYWTGAGKAYNRFSFNAVPSPNIPNYPTPNFPSEIPNPTNVPNVPTEPLPSEPNPTNIPNVPTPSNPKGEIPVNCLWGDCSGNLPQIPSDLIPKSLKDLLTPTPRTNVNAPPTLFSFLPNMNNGGSNMFTTRNIVFLAIAVIVGYYLYKKYA